MYTFIPSPTAQFCEIYQDSDLKFACVNIDKEQKTATQLHDFVKCRDFLNDALIATKQGVKSYKIYGFSFNGKTNPMNTKTLEYVIKGSDFSKLRHNLKMFNEFQQQFMGARPTTLTRMKGAGDDKLLLRASPVWMRSTVTISLFTHFIRSLYQYNHDGAGFIDWMERVAQQEGNASSYQVSLNQIDFEAVLVNVRKLFPLNAEFLDVTDSEYIELIHDQGGLVTFTNAIRFYQEWGHTSEDYYQHDEAVERYIEL